MKGAMEIPFNLLIAIIGFLIVIAIIFMIFASQKTGLKGFLNLGCDTCNLMIGNAMSGLTFHVLNPCVMLFNCCDENAAGGCSGSSSSQASSGTTTTVYSSPVW